MVGDGAGHDAAASVEEADQRDEERGVRLGQAALLRDLNTACRQYLALHLVIYRDRENREFSVWTFA